MTRRAFLVMVLLTACHRAPPPRLKLDTGETIELLAVHRLSLADGRTTLTIHYRTQLPLEDRTAIEREAAAVRAQLAERIEHVHADRVVLYAHTLRRRWLRTVDRSTSVAFEKDENGAWRPAAGR